MARRMRPLYGGLLREEAAGVKPGPHWRGKRAFVAARRAPWAIWRHRR